MAKEVTGVEIRSARELRKGLMQQAVPDLRVLAVAKVEARAVHLGGKEVAKPPNLGLFIFLSIQPRRRRTALASWHSSSLRRSRKAVEELAFHHRAVSWKVPEWCIPASTALQSDAAYQEQWFDGYCPGALPGAEEAHGDYDWAVGKEPPDADEMLRQMCAEAERQALPVNDQHHPHPLQPAQLSQERLALNDWSRVDHATVSQALQNLSFMDVDEEAVPLGAEKLVEVVSAEKQEEPLTERATPPCLHTRTTKKGSNKYYELVTCLDCQKVVSRTSRTSEEAKSSTSSTTTKAAGLKDPVMCSHHNVTWKGSNGVQRKSTCLDCGKVTYSHDSVEKPTTSTSMSRPEKSYSLVEVQEIFKNSAMVASVKSFEDPHQRMSHEGIHKIIDAVSLAIQSGTSSSSMTSQMPVGPPSVRKATTPPKTYMQTKDGKIVGFGKYKGKPYWYAYSDPDYVKWALEEVSEHSQKSMKDLVQYFKEKLALSHEHRPVAMMAVEEEQKLGNERSLVAILDSGCNKTCHGERWMQRYFETVQGDFSASCPLVRDEGHFNGIGGKVETCGLRHLNVGFELLDDGIAVGLIVSTELKGSDAPLLLSIEDQRQLGLCVELAADEDRVFSTTLSEHLKVTRVNGLLGIHLLPAHVAMLSVNVEEKKPSSPLSTKCPELESCEKGDSCNGVSLSQSTEDAADQLDKVEKDGEMSPSSQSSGELLAGDVYLSISENDHKPMSKGQRRTMEQQLKEIEQGDQCLWSALQQKRHRLPLPRGCRVFLLEICAGAAMLSSMAVGMGYSVSQPVDIKLDGSDLLNPDVRREIDRCIDEFDPYLITLAPICGPWSPWSHVNMSKSETTADFIQEQRDAWYPTLKWMSQLVRRRVAKGRKVLLENPWTSCLWSTLCFDKLIGAELRDAESGNLLELVRSDQCAFGLRDRKNNLLHRKPTGFLTASDTVKNALEQRCSGDHFHQTLEGGSRTKLAQEWPAQLCETILQSFIEEMQERSLRAAYYDEALEEEQGESLEFDMGTLDYVHNEKDMASRDLIPLRHDEQELARQEELEEKLPVGELMEKESERRQKWLQAPRAVRLALRRLHTMTGHSPNSSMIQLLRTGGASPKVLQAARHFSCETCKKRQDVEPTNKVKIPSKTEFNHEIAIDAFEIRDSVGNRFTILSSLCVGTLFHQGWVVAEGGVPRSSACADALQQGWFSPFGSPNVVSSDRGMHNRGKLQDLLRVHGVYLRYTGVEAAHQLGRAERQQGILKKSAMEERQIVGLQEVKWLVAETTMVKNCRLNHRGFTPTQWVLGKLPRDVTSLTSEEIDGNLGVQEDLMSPEDEFTKILEIRQAAKMAFARVDASRRIRAALLRKSVPLRGPYNIGDLVCVHRRGRWYGPARIVGREGRGLFWVIHGGVPITAPEHAMRPATAAEVYAKRLMEMRPSRKRRRELLQEDEIRPDPAVPFSEDLYTPSFMDDEQPSFLDLSQEGAVRLDGVAASEPPVPEVRVPEEQEETGGEVVEEETPFPEVTQPESEQAPSTAPSVPATPDVRPVPADQTALQQALRRSPDALDGHPVNIVPPPGLSTIRERSRSPHRDPADIPVPGTPGASPIRGDQLRNMDQFLAEKQARSLHGFLAKRMFKKKRQVGAGRELNFNKSSKELQTKILEKRAKEWKNWRTFEATRVIPPDQVADFLAQNPTMEVLPTRWVDTDKAEVGQEEELKSRLVARGDLEENQELRTDSPTVSQIVLALIISFAAATGKRLRSGDISAAFLQGTGIQRLLRLRLPDGGIPDPDVLPGSLLVCLKSVYGTRDAPRGFWKGLHDVLLACGLKGIDLETSAYYLPGPQGEVCGILGCHVDDLLWCGNEQMDAVMTKVQQRYNFGVVNASEFKFCGRIISQQKDGISIRCPNVLDRVKNIYISPERRKNRGEAATASEISQLRSVLGSVAWLSRVCRPDLAFAVNQLQAVQQKAKVNDLLMANKLLSKALATKDYGVFFPAGIFDFEKAVLVSINDASHAASFEGLPCGETAGHRSQSGRLLVLTHEDFLQSGKGPVHLLSWHSNTIKRVCRSTLQAETLSLQLGSEECEHVRQVLYQVKNHAPEGTSPSFNYVGALDHMMCTWMTDCRSLHDHLLNTTISEISDKRLAIDLTSLRQEIWREKGQMIGNPMYKDALDENKTTNIVWIPTTHMAADGLTKEMNCEQLQKLMRCGMLDVGLTPVKT